MASCEKGYLDYARYLSDYESNQRMKRGGQTPS